MKRISRYLLLSVALLLTPHLSHAIDRVYTSQIQLPAVSTQNVVAVSSLTNTTVLAANTQRVDFDVQLTSCTTPGQTSTILYYGYNAFTVITATSTNAYQMDQQQSSGQGDQFFKKPDNILYTGAIYAQASAAGCVVTVTEWVNSSPLFQ